MMQTPRRMSSYRWGRAWIRPPERYRASKTSSRRHEQPEDPTQRPVVAGQGVAWHGWLVLAGQRSARYSTGGRVGKEPTR
jgi:hypothetical protein